MTDQPAREQRDLPNRFDEQVAERYDAELGEMGSPAVVDATVDRLVELADGGPALEFAVGTGRIALPLADRGIDVHGVELSPTMLDRLRVKPGGLDLPVTIGDMTSVTVPGAFRLVFLVFNTIMNLTSQDAQVACFRNAAAHLAPGGRFVIEVTVPDLRWLPPGQTVVPFHLDPDRVGFDEYDVVNQRLVSHHFTIDDQTGRHTAFPCRYVWPAELDLMAQLAGMRLTERWGGWRHEPFTAESRSHVSVWEKPTDATGR